MKGFGIRAFIHQTGLSALVIIGQILSPAVNVLAQGHVGPQRVRLKDDADTAPLRRNVPRYRRDDRVAERPVRYERCIEKAMEGMAAVFAA